VATLRIARRDALRHKVRSALVIAMVAIPVLGLTSADVLARTMQLSVAEHVDREIGQADAAIVYAGGRITQGVDPAQGYESTGKAVPPGSPAAARLQAQALNIIGSTGSLATVLDTSALVSAGGLRVDTEVTRLDLTDPLTGGMTRLTDGRVPATAAEVAVTPHLAKRLDLKVGGSVDIGGQSRTITGFVQDPQSLAGDEVYASAVPPHDRRDALILTATTRPVSWSEIQQLNQLGYVVTSPSVVEHPPAAAAVFNQSNPVANSTRIGIATVAVGLAVLEVVLLAGAAFAVGARRQRHDLALLAAAGGDARQVRQVVLAGGLGLGAVGAVVGLGAGIGLARLALWPVARLVGRAPGHFDIRGLELLAVLVLGLLTGLAASLLPARSAGRDDVVAALTGRRGVLSTPRRVPVLGLAMVVFGALFAFHAARSAQFWEILGGAVVSELGFVVCAPAVVGAAGRLARFLPLSPRLALRDAARHRGRSGPAVAAVMAAIAGSIAVSAYFVSTVHRDRETYIPQARIGQPVLELSPGGHDFASRRDTALAVFRRDLGASKVVPVPTADCRISNCHPIYVMGARTDADTLAVGGPALLRVLLGRSDAAAERALLAGKVVAFSPQPVSIVREHERAGTETAVQGAQQFLVDPGPSGVAAAAIASPATAAALHATTTVATYLAITPTEPSQAQQDHANDQFGDPSAMLIIDRGYEPGHYSVGLIVLAIAAGLVTLGATAISVGLSMAESKPDLVTLAAVGGRPRTRRLLVANQAGSVALLGAVQGVVAGLIPAWAILRAGRSIPFVLPWTTILVVVVGIPLLAMAGTAALAGSRLTLDRRPT
jgi:putative ABC transport system permease protein